MLYYQARYHYEYLEFNSTSKLRISVEHAPQIPQARGEGAGLFICAYPILLLLGQRLLR